MLRRLVAFTIAPVTGIAVAAFCLEVVVLVLAPFQVISDLVGLYGVILYGVVTVGAMPAYVVTVIVGMPLHAWFETRGWRAPHRYLALGAGLSLLAFLLGHLQSSLLEIAGLAIPATVIGGLAGGAVFRRICFRRWFTDRPASVTTAALDVHELKGILPKPKRKLSLRKIDRTIGDAVTARRKE